MKKIFVTGGHFAPAKAVIQELLTRGRLPAGRQGWQIYYLGRKYSMEGESSLALEFTEIRSLPVTYLTITTGRIQRQFFVNVGQSILAFLKIFVGLAQSLFWLIRYQPDAILSFGGYVAVPVVVWAWLLRIPILTHEQTTVSGRANKLMALLADKVLVSWPQSLFHFPKDKVVLTGNPIREEILKQKPSFTNLIYVTGGSQGAHAINIAVEKILPKLLSRYRVVHQAGATKKYDDFARLSRIKNPNYHVYPQLSGQHSAEYTASASLVIGRAGANFVTEVLALGKKAILVPLPNTFGHEQEENAKRVAGVGLAEVLPQADLTPEKLLRGMTTLLSQPKKEYHPAIPLDAAKKISDELEKLSL